MTEEIVLKAYSECGERDWYGDYSYYPNPLEHYIKKSNLWCSEVKYASGRGDGIESITVFITEENLKLLGWEEDLKYKK